MTIEPEDKRKWINQFLCQQGNPALTGIGGVDIPYAERMYNLYLMQFAHLNIDEPKPISDMTNVSDLIDNQSMTKTLELAMLKPFDIMLEGSSSWLSRQIQEVIQEKISHSGVFFTVDNVLYIHESDRYGLRNTDFTNYYLKDPKFKFWIARPKVKPTVQQIREFRHLAIRTAGHKPYDFFNLLFHQPVKWIMQRVFNKEVWWGKRKIKAHQRFICSERTAYIMDRFFGIEEDWHKISTEHFLHSNNYDIYELKR